MKTKLRIPDITYLVWRTSTAEVRCDGKYHWVVPDDHGQILVDGPCVCAAVTA